VNPSVGVSYNGATNAGIGVSSFNRGQQAKLPYRVMMDGAFRPPVLAPVDLLPLSRMPRLVTKVNCAVNMPNYQKKLACEANKNTYRPKLLNKSCVASATQNIQKPSVVIDRRHTNVRKNAQPINVISNKNDKRNNKQDVRGFVDVRTRPHLSGYIETNQYKGRHDTATGMQNVHKHIGTTLKGDVFVPTGGPKKTTTAPASLQGCRDTILRPQILPANVIGRIVDTTYPEYKRAFGMGGIRVPENGVYNTARR
jgi:hypothetical protein